MKILNIDPDRYSDNANKIYGLIGEYHCISNITRQNLKEIIHDYDILVLRLSQKIDLEILKKASNLKYIVTNCTGIDHIDIAECVKRNITVVSLKGEIDFLRGIHSTAELTWGLVIDSFRNISKAQNSISVESIWNRDLFFGRDLYGKRIGILGFGRIGEKIAKYALAFGMIVESYDPDPLCVPSDVFFHTSIESFFSSQLDLITISVSLDDSTKYLVDRDLLSKVTRGLTVVNTSRGAIVNERDMIGALRSGMVRCYVTDVLEGENEHDFLIDSEMIVAKKEGLNISITPHIGGVTSDSWWKTEEFCAEKLYKLIYNEEIK